METENMTSVQMPRYRCHKEVWALKIADIQRIAAIQDQLCESDGKEGGAWIVPEGHHFARFRVSADYLRRHKPEVGGYFVTYQDGYQSYSPAKAFEEFMDAHTEKLVSVRSRRSFHMTYTCASRT